MPLPYTLPKFYTIDDIPLYTDAYMLKLTLVAKLWAL